LLAIFSSMPQRVALLVYGKLLTAFIT